MPTPGFPAQLHPDDPTILIRVEIRLLQFANSPSHPIIRVSTPAIPCATVRNGRGLAPFTRYTHVTIGVRRNENAVRRRHRWQVRGEVYRIAGRGKFLVRLGTELADDDQPRVNRDADTNRLGKRE